MEATINSAVFSHEFGNNPVVRVHTVVADGVNYQCFAPSILNKIGQKVQFDVLPSKDPKYPARMKLIDNSGFGGGFKGKSGGYGGNDPEITAKNCVLMQLVEIVKIYQNSFNTAQDALKFVQDNICPVWASYGYKKPETASSEGTTPQINHKTLTTMLSEIKIIPSMAVFSSWWNENTPSIKALSPGDRQILFSEKSQKSMEIENQALVSDEIPF
jgi:hypothetical protein